MKQLVHMTENFAGFTCPGPSSDYADDKAIIAIAMIALFCIFVWSAIKNIHTLWIRAAFILLGAVLSFVLGALLSFGLIPWGC